MHPEIRESRAHARLGLRDLVGMVDRNMVLAATVNVEEIAEVSLRHRRALDMPAGETLSPGALPFHLALFARRRELPQREVGRMPLLAKLDALAGLEPRLVQAREVAVVG